MKTFVFNNEFWKYEDGILYHFYDDKWIYHSCEISKERALTVAETHSFGFVKEVLE